MKKGKRYSEAAKLIEKTNLYLTQYLMRSPSLQEIANFMEIDEYLIVEALNSTNILLVSLGSNICVST